MAPSPESFPLAAASSDADLVTACLDGDRNAFAHIVDRYKRLLCSLAYAAVGDVSESEDIAQDAFVEAWKHLRDLREPEKLRSWLCGIVRHQVGRSRRRDGREPVRGAECLEAAESLTSPEEPVMAQAMQREESELLWSELSRVPALYREPLILYYREHGSIEHVAAALELSEDAVKQRLARGRRILQERVLSFVEGALARSTPGRVFTIGVLATLPQWVPPAKAAGFGAAAALHGGTLAKTTGLAALLASISGVVNTVMQLRANLDQSRTPRERRAVVIATIACFFGSLAFLGVLWLIVAASYRWWNYRLGLALAAQIMVGGFIVGWPVIVVRMMAFFRRLRSSERREHPECFLDARDQVGSSAGEYRSRARLLGVPLVHFRFATPDDGQRPVFGWIAGGDRAFGLLFAWGGWAVAPISVGAVSVGLLSVGALGIGVISLGTFALGFVAVGSVSVGVKAYAWLSALGWATAQSNGFGVARLAAMAPVAWAEHANDAAAMQLLVDPHAERNQMLFFMAIVVLSMVPMAYYAREVRRRLGRRAAARPSPTVSAADIGD